MTCDRFSSREALQYGLVNHVVPAEEVLEAAMKIARELNALPPLAVRWTKLSVNKWIKHQLNLIHPPPSGVWRRNQVIQVRS